MKIERGKMKKNEREREGERERERERERRTHTSGGPKTAFAIQLNDLDCAVFIIAIFALSSVASLFPLFV